MHEKQRLFYWDKSVIYLTRLCTALALTAGCGIVSTQWGLAGRMYGFLVGILVCGVDAVLVRRLVPYRRDPWTRQLMSSLRSERSYES